MVLEARAATDHTCAVVTADGSPVTPEAYAALLSKLSAGVKVDDYSNGGTVARLEQKVAAAFGRTDGCPAADWQADVVYFVALLKEKGAVCSMAFAPKSVTFLLMPTMW